MKTTKFIAAAAMAAALTSLGAHAQSPTQAPAAQAAPVPTEVIYLPQLPTAAQLIGAASASHGVTIQKIDQTSTQITVVYKYDNGQTNTVAYNLIAAADSSAVPAPGAVPAPSTPPPAVVSYAVPASPYYYSYGADYSYYPAWYPPVVLGFDWGWGFHGGGWGYRGGWGFHGGGGHWR